MTEVRSEIVSYQVDDLIPYENNPKNHPANQIDQIVDSINEWGWTMPLLIDEQNNIIAGHGRLLAAKKLGINEVPCIIAREWSDEKKKAYCIADNKLTENSTWSKDFLKLNFEFLIENDFDLNLTGFNADEIADLIPDFSVEEGLTDEDDVPEIPAEPVTKLGDIWLLGEHRVMCGDSTDVDSINALTDNNNIEMVYTDPPYGIDYHANTEGSGTGLSATKRTLHDKIIGDADTTIAVKVVDLVLDMFADSSMVFWGANYYCQAIPNGYGWLFWDKKVDMPTFSDGEFAFTNRGVRSSVFEHKWTGMLRDSERGTARLHPNQKPVALAEWCFDNYGDPQTILDLFLGSGSTLIASENKNRKCYGMELDPKYVDVIIKRWQDFTGQEAILESTSESFNSLQ
jgi:16S rRNA G966 N2-methylase RsmD